MAETLTREQFDSQAHLDRYKDVASHETASLDPYQHYLDYGIKEGRIATALSSDSTKT
jgi:hypothetical protein